MANDPINLNKHRGRAAPRKGYREIRRHRLHALRTDAATQWRRQDELKFRLLGATASTWPDVVATANYLIDLFAATPRARNLRRREVTAHTLGDFTRPVNRRKNRHD